MVKYTPNPENDQVLCLWWQELMSSGDMADYPVELQTLSIFYRSLQEPTTLLVESDEQGIWFAFWYRPSSLPFAIINLWIRSDYRQKKSALVAVHLAFTNVFQDHATVVAYCGDPKVATLYEGFGLGRHAPDIYCETHAVTVFSLTRDQYHNIVERGH